MTTIVPARGIHAGEPPQWSASLVRRLARDEGSTTLETMLRGALAVFTFGSHHVRLDWDDVAMLYGHRDEAWGKVARPTYRREPNIRITLENGSTVDGKSMVWTKDKVYVLWLADLERHLVWMDAHHVTGIHRDESSWTDTYDDIAYYYPDEPIDEWD